jgi:hypothetical protein
MCVPLSKRAHEADDEGGLDWGDVRGAWPGLMCVPLSKRAYEADGGGVSVAWGDVRAAIEESL